jgi:3-methyladenine DNA glycosylase/8-oxoguanine DNA glycosylase
MMRLGEIMAEFGGRKREQQQILQVLAEIQLRLEVIETKLGGIMTAQDDINAAVAAVQGLATDIATQVAQLGTDVTAIRAELTTLQGQGVDTSALNTLVSSIASTQSSLDTAVTSVGNLVPVATPGT